LSSTSSRGFQHVLIGHAVLSQHFRRWRQQLRIGEDAKNLFAKTSGLPPTMGTIDSPANEIIRDVREGVQAFKFLLEKNELQSATKRLAETFMIGEYLPAVRTLDRGDKRRALSFVPLFSERPMRAREVSWLVGRGAYKATAFPFSTVQTIA
jgi:hypothetical protein